MRRSGERDDVVRIDSSNRMTSQPTSLHASIAVPDRAAAGVAAVPPGMHPVRPRVGRGPGDVEVDRLAGLEQRSGYWRTGGGQPAWSSAAESRCSNSALAGRAGSGASLQPALHRRHAVLASAPMAFEVRRGLGGVIRPRCHASSAARSNRNWLNAAASPNSIRSGVAIAQPVGDATSRRRRRTNAYGGASTQPGIGSAGTSAGTVKWMGGVGICRRPYEPAGGPSTEESDRRCAVVASPCSIDSNVSGDGRDSNDAWARRRRGVRRLVGARDFDVDQPSSPIS